MRKKHNFNIQDLKRVEFFAFLYIYICVCVCVCVWLLKNDMCWLLYDV